MTRIVIHIGPAKTGSTALQRFFVNRGDALRSLGVSYPITWQDHLDGHHQLAYALLEAPRGASDQRQLLHDQATRVVKDAPCVLLSAEALARLPGPGLELLHELFEGHEREIIYYVRAWTGLIPSAWQEAVKQGSSEPLEAYVQHAIKNAANSDMLTWTRVLDRYASVFGHSALRIVPYEALAPDPGLLTSHFIQEILSVELGSNDSELVNRSWAPEHIELVRALNSMAARRGITTSASWPRVAFRRSAAAGEIDPEGIYAQLRLYRTSLTIQPDADGYRKAWSDLMLRYGDRMEHARSSDPELPAPSRVVEYVSADYEADSALMDRIEKILDRLSSPDPRWRPGEVA